jgi:hypothetical protein
MSADGLAHSDGEGSDAASGGASGAAVDRYYGQEVFGQVRLCHVAAVHEYLCGMVRGDVLPTVNAVYRSPMCEEARCRIRGRLTDAGTGAAATLLTRFAQEYLAGDAVVRLSSFAPFAPLAHSPHMRVLCVAQAPGASILATLAALEDEEDGEGEVDGEDEEDAEGDGLAGGRAALAQVLAGQDESLPMSHFVDLVRLLQHCPPEHSHE